MRKKKTVLISDPPTVEKAGILVLYQKISPLMEYLNFPPSRYEFKDSKTRYVKSILPPCENKFPLHLNACTVLK